MSGMSVSGVGASAYYPKPAASGQAAAVQEEQKPLADALREEQESQPTLADMMKEAQEKVASGENDLFSAYNTYRWAVDHGILN